MKSFVVNQNDAGQRLDKYITKLCPLLPKALLYKGIRKKRIKVNGKAGKLNQILEEGEKIELYINDEFFEDTVKDILDIKVDLDIIYEDKNIIVVNKPSGMVVHEDEGEKVNTLINQIIKYLFDKEEYLPKRENTFVPALCNRIDRNTSGLVIAAKNAATLRIINEKIKQREIKKYYYCMIKGRLKQKKAIMKAFLKRDKIHKMVHVYDHPISDGRTILTAYEVIKEMEETSLLQVELLTGRTHQIRAHFAYIGHPLVGDGKYGDNQFNKKMKRNRQALCAYKLLFDFKTESEHLEYLKGSSIEIPKEKCDFYSQCKHLFDI